MEEKRRAVLPTASPQFSLAKGMYIGRGSKQDGRSKQLPRWEKNGLHGAPQTISKSEQKENGRGEKTQGISSVVKGRISNKESPCNNTDGPSNKGATPSDGT